MKEIPQEIRVSSMAISFVDATDQCGASTSVVTIEGAVVTESGNVCKFSFARGKIIFNDRTVKFNRTIKQQLEMVLEAYARGAMKINVIHCEFSNMPSEIESRAELEDE
jgi:hypothetical protein